MYGRIEGSPLIRVGLKISWNQALRTRNQLSASSKPTFFLWCWCLTLFVELLIDHSPSWKSTKVSVVDEEVCMDLSRYIIRVGSFFRITTIYSIWRDALIVEELDRFIKFSAVSVGPENDAMPVVLEHLEGFNSEGFGLTYGGVFVFDDGAVKIYCYE